MNAEIISIGDELLTGQTINSNASWLANELHNVGIPVRQISVVSDEEAEILRSLKEAESRAELILISGGLGPTRDDKTREALCKYFNVGLVQDRRVLEDIELMFGKRGLRLTETNSRQALVPEGCKVIRNKNGTAPGLWFERNKKIFIAMPGVPFEFKPMVLESLLPALKEKNADNRIVHRTILTHGIGESFLADKINTWEKEIPHNINLAYLPSPGIVKLRLSGTGKNHQHIKRDIDALIKKLTIIIPEYIFGEDTETMHGVVSKILREKCLTLSVAESCTGGMISHMLTTVPGASQYFKGSIVAYDNEIKTRQLGVDKELIEKYGAVSKQVVEAMATGIKNIFDTNYAISTTGIAGPDGGTAKKPVGMVWIALATKDNIVSKKFLFGHNRERNILITAIAALNMLRLQLGYGVKR